MIPAILSCIYVIYLYQTLNHADDSEGTATNGKQQSPMTPELLSARMEQIQTRLEKLAKGAET